jgi:hypothetical protein
MAGPSERFSAFSFLGSPTQAASGIYMRNVECSSTFVEASTALYGGIKREV